jgi:hypothetical protein
MVAMAGSPDQDVTRSLQSASSDVSPWGRFEVLWTAALGAAISWIALSGLWMSLNHFSGSLTLRSCRYDAGESKTLE